MKIHIHPPVIFGLLHLLSLARKSLKRAKEATNPVRVICLPGMQKEDNFAAAAAEAKQFQNSFHVLYHVVLFPALRTNHHQTKTENLTKNHAKNQICFLFISRRRHKLMGTNKETNRSSAFCHHRHPSSNSPTRRGTSPE